MHALIYVVCKVPGVKLQINFRKCWILTAALTILSLPLYVCVTIYTRTTFILRRTLHYLRQSRNKRRLNRSRVGCKAGSQRRNRTNTKRRNARKRGEERRGRGGRGGRGRGRCAADDAGGLDRKKSTNDGQSRGKRHSHIFPCQRSQK